ncbi:hypothetical protein [Lentzea flava]|uniref:hypothetical protein n=1 Tax=Lentzea flava TaxID=103732 RepID=UPI0016711559|nr:hypothetical protein [Lentzea flava]
MLDPLGRDSARHLLTRSLDLVGSAAEQAALEDLIALCAGIRFCSDSSQRG